VGIWQLSDLVFQCGDCLELKNFLGKEILKLLLEAPFLPSFRIVSCLNCCPDPEKEGGKGLMRSSRY
jgi:hypothetical protein